jgi:hypothetical protein
MSLDIPLIINTPNFKADRALEWVVRDTAIALLAAAELIALLSHLEQY